MKFNQVQERDPKDRAAQEYLERAAHFMVHGVPDDWVGGDSELDGGVAIPKSTASFKCPGLAGAVRELDPEEGLYCGCPTDDF